MSVELAAQKNLMLFRLGGATFALPIEPIAQIIPMVTITPLPQASDIVSGIINVRGALTPVINLSRHLNLPQAPLQLHTPILLVQCNGRMMGFIVDEVIDVMPLQTREITRPKDILPEALVEAPLLGGLASTGDGTVFVLDIENLFLPHQADALAQATAAISGDNGRDGGEKNEASGGEGGPAPATEDSKAESSQAKSRQTNGLTAIAA
jgi:purine-binding chemotaxis protein CheW